MIQLLTRTVFSTKTLLLEIGLRGQCMFTRDLGYLSFVYIHMFRADRAPLVTALVFSSLLVLE